MIANRKLRTSCELNKVVAFSPLMLLVRHEVYRIILNDQLYEAPIGENPQVSPSSCSCTNCLLNTGLEGLGLGLRYWNLGHVSVEDVILVLIEALIVAVNLPICIHLQTFLVLIFRPSNLAMCHRIAASRLMMLTKSGLTQMTTLISFMSEPCWAASPTGRSYSRKRSGSLTTMMILIDSSNPS